jgi:hypothetical protein
MFPIRINLELWIVWMVGKTALTVISFVARPLPTQDNKTQKKTRTDIDASKGIRTQDLSVEQAKTVTVLGMCCTGNTRRSPVGEETG